MYDRYKNIPDVYIGGKNIDYATYINILMSEIRLFVKDTTSKIKRLGTCLW